MTELNLTAVRARHGDALLLTHQDTRILIDGGAHGVYGKFLRPHLQALAQGREEPLPIDLLIVSHIDSDHIAGILDLVDELVEADEERSRPLVAIEEAWHNSFSDLIPRGDAEGATAAQASVEAASVEAASVELASLVSVDDLLKHHMPDAPAVISSVSQGRRLRNNLERLRVDVNRAFPRALALSNTRMQAWERSGLTLKVIGPGVPELDALRKTWKRQLPKLLDRERQKKARAEAARSLDRSVFNLSSIVLIAQTDQHRLLLTGDARGDMILEWLPGTANGGTEHFDIIKLPHHGSNRNATPDFFARVTAEHYLISGDGRHGNPEPELLEMLFAARPTINYLVHMTYSLAEMAEQSQFDVAAFKAMLAKDPQRAACLRFPDAGSNVLTVSA